MRTLANEAIDNFILGKEAKDFKHEYIKDDVCPSCDIDNKVIYSPVLPTIIDPAIDAVIRGKNAHEAGHGRFTPGNKKPEWSVTKGFLINALEDLRIERGVAHLSDALADDLLALNKHGIELVCKKFQSEGANCGVINEAIFALMIKEQGGYINWQISDTAKELIELAETDFAMWKDADYTSKKGFDLIEKIADIIISKWEKYISENTPPKQNEAGETGNEAGEATEGESGNEAGEATEGEAGNEVGEATDGEAGNEAGEATDGETGNEAGESAEGEAGNEAGEEDENNATSTSNGGTDNGSGSVLDEYCDKENLVEKMIQDEIKKAVETSINEFGEYIAYTNNDKVITADDDEYAFNKAKEKVAGAISMFSGYLEQSLRSMSRCRKIGNRDRGMLDVRALPAFAKNLTKNVFYTQKQGISLDTTVSILIDESGSMDECGKVLACRSVAIALAEVLNRLNIKFEILGHHTGGSFVSSDDILYHRKKSLIIDEFKCFNEQYQKVKYRLGDTQASSCNIDSEALLYTFKRAMEQRSNRHIIIVLSDGMPSGAINHEIGTKHLMKVTEFCRKNGAEVYAFGILTDAPKYLYGDDYFVHLKSIADFQSEFFRSVAKIIAK